MSRQPDHSTVITNVTVLQEGFVPNDSIHRNQEVNAISRALDPIRRGQTGGPALLTGPSGVGKTTFAQYAVSELQSVAPDVRAIHVNCWEAHTWFKTLYAILKELDKAYDLHRRSTARDELLDRLRDVDGPLVVTLDEVDQLDDAGVVYDLYTMSHVSLVAITNDATELLSTMDDRVRSRLQTATQVQFDAYATRELRDILQARVEHGLVDDAITRQQLVTIADAAAGDARVGLSILRTAAQSAEYDGRERVSETDIKEAIPAAKQAVRARAIQTLRPEQQELYQVLDQAGEISPGELYERYSEAVDDPPTKRTVRSWLQKLTHYDLVEAEGHGPDRRYSVVREDPATASA